jgi:uncharacterized protein YjbJ (UPF0337 family)
MPAFVPTTWQPKEQHFTEGVFMDKERIKGKAQDIAGRVERQVGEWTGDDKAQADGLAKQAEGKTRNVIGKLKDGVRDATDKLNDTKTENEDRDLDKDVA